jgi:hypothetical protein
MRFPNPFRYYRVFGARAGSGFPTAIQGDSVANLVFFRSLLGEGQKLASESSSIDRPFVKLTLQLSHEEPPNKARADRYHQHNDGVRLVAPG